MATYYVDDGGDNTTGAAWATAYTSLSALDDAVTIASGDIIYVGHDHNCQYTHAANRTITGPASGLPCTIISVTQGSSPPTYQAGTGTQIDTTEGAYSLTFDGSFALYGLKMHPGNSIYLFGDDNESMLANGCKFVMNNGGTLYTGTTYGNTIIVNCTVDLTNDTSTSSVVIQHGGVSLLKIQNLSFVSATNRTGYIFSITNACVARISGCDFSGFTNATACEVLNATTAFDSIFLDCKTAATWTPFTTATPSSDGDHTFINCGNGDQPTSLINKNYFGDIVSSSTIYRSSGGAVEGTSTGWLVTTNASTSQDSPYYSPWIYGRITATGSKTFDLYITNDTADFNDDEAWLEVEYKGASSSGLWSLATDRAADRLATAAAQTDDTTSTWTGTGPSFTYKQKLSVTATVNTTGMFRARVAVGKASIASSRYFYIDPNVTVT